MRQNGITDRIRSILREFNGPMTIAQILEALPPAVERNNVNALLVQRKKAGEFAVQLIGGKPHYSLVQGYVKAYPQRTPNAAKSFTPPAPKKGAHTDVPAGPAPVANEPPAPSRTPVAAAFPSVAHAAALEPSRRKAIPNDPSSLLVSVRVNTVATAALLRSIADLLDPREAQ